MGGFLALNQEMEVRILLPELQGLFRGNSLQTSDLQRSPDQVAAFAGTRYAPCCRWASAQPSLISLARRVQLPDLRFKFATMDRNAGRLSQRIIHRDGRCQMTQRPAAHRRAAWRPIRKDAPNRLPRRPRFPTAAAAALPKRHRPGTTSGSGSAPAGRTT